MSWIYKLAFAAASLALARALWDANGNTYQGSLKKSAPGEKKKPAYPVSFSHFVSEHPDIMETFQAEHGHEPPTIATEFCPGFRLSGSFFVYLGGHPGSGYGDVSVVSRGGERISERNYPQYPYLHLCLYPDLDDGLSTLSWEKIESALPDLAIQAVRVGLEIYRPGTDKHDWATALARQLLADNQDSIVIRELCKEHDLAFSRAQDLRSAKPDPEELLMSRAGEFNFSSASWNGDDYIVSRFSGEPLILNRKERKLRVPYQGEIVEFSLDGLKVTRKDRELDSDTKTHLYSYIFFSQGDKSASVYQRFKDYYEGGRVQVELDKTQDVSKAALNRLARVLKSGDLDKL